MTIEMELRGEAPEAARPPPAVRSPSRGSLKSALMNIIKPNAET